MTEIRMDIDFGHAPDVVWRALTEQGLLARWFMLTDLEPTAGARFQLMPEGLPGFPDAVDGEVTEAEPERRLVMRWQGEQLHSRVTWELTPTPAGCTLAVSQSGFLGLRGSVRRRALVSTYRQLFGVRLAAVLDGLGGDAEAVVPPPPRAASEAPAPPARRRRLLMVAAAALLIALVGVLVANLPSETSEPAGAETGGSGGPVASFTAATAAPTAAATRRTPGRAPTSAPAGSAPATAPPPTLPAAEATAAPPAALSARYATLSTGLLNYRGEVAVGNSGGTAAERWTVTITVPVLAVVTGVSGPSPSRNGTTVTFTGSAVPAGASARLSFDVTLNALGPMQPLSCHIDGTPCAGL